MLHPTTASGALHTPSAPIADIRDLTSMLRRRFLTTAKEKAAREAKDEAADPLRHFRAFGSMDEYVRATLVQYENRNEEAQRPPSEEEAAAPPAGGGHAHDE